MYLFCFLEKFFYQGSKEETLEIKWKDLYITVDFFSNWKHLDFKQIKFQLLWNSVTKAWDFYYMKTEEWNYFMP